MGTFPPDESEYDHIKAGYGFIIVAIPQPMNFDQYPFNKYYDSISPGAGWCPKKLF